jgi:hypothetical protein
MSLPVSTTISGMDSLAVLQQNLKIASGFKPLSAEALQATRDRVRTFAADGRYELFKTTTKYDGKAGREQHHYPPSRKAPRLALIGSPRKFRPASRCGMTSVLPYGTTVRSTELDFTAPSPSFCRGGISLATEMVYLPASLKS